MALSNTERVVIGICFAIIIGLVIYLAFFHKQSFSSGMNPHLNNDPACFTSNPYSIPLYGDNEAQLEGKRGDSYLYM